jgi:hypothetical protein
LAESQQNHVRSLGGPASEGVKVDIAPNHDHTMRVRTLAVVVASVCGLALVVYSAGSPWNVVRRKPRLVSGTPRVASDVRGSWTPGPPILVSPNGRLAAYHVLVADRYHTVTILDGTSGVVTPVVSVEEADPGSGYAHRLAWSTDSRVLLIGGSGRLGGGPAKPLCVEYEVGTNDLRQREPCTEAVSTP